MTSENESTLTDEESNIIQGLRDRGFCVAVFTPEQIGEADVGDLEDILIDRGQDFINFWRENHG